jgi:hypothetical protein
MVCLVIQLFSARYDAGGSRLAELTILVKRQEVLPLVEGLSAIATTANEHGESLIVCPSFRQPVVPQRQLIRVNSDVLEGGRVRDDLFVSLLFFSSSAV